MATSTIVMSCPLDTVQVGYVNTELTDADLKGLSGATWVQFVNGLRSSNATVNGVPVKTSKDAIAWFIWKLQGN